MNICGFLGNVPKFVSSLPSLMPYRPNCIIDLSGNRVNKEYTCADARARVAHLKVIYGLLHTKKVPHTDELKYAHSTSVILSPRGVEREPEDDKDLRNVISYIVEALKVILVTKRAVLDAHVNLLKVAHDEPSPLFHRDIRWNNVLCQIEDPISGSSLTGKIRVWPRLRLHLFSTRTLTRLMYLRIIMEQRLISGVLGS